MLNKETHDLIHELHAKGMSKLQIANHLKLAFNTVKKHIRNPEWHPYKKSKALPIEDYDEMELNIAEYERRCMKWRTGC